MNLISPFSSFELLPIESGQVNTPAIEAGAQGQSHLDTKQVAAAIGEPIPIVFARRRNGKGGILISPKATEARFENNTANDVTAHYHYVLSEGQIDKIPLKDIFQSACRRGSIVQTYNRRADRWLPGNFVVERAGHDLPECPRFCGSVGAYSGMSTASYKVTIPDGFDQWNRQVHFFIRGGLHVKRLVDSAPSQPSDNFADLVNWMYANSHRVPSQILDEAALKAAAIFLEKNELTCNCEIKESVNVPNFVSAWAPYFLLGESRREGKRGLRPLLPAGSDGTIRTSPVVSKYTFDEDVILPDTLEVYYLPLADRHPFVVQAIWRQQLEDDFGIIRTLETRFANTPANAPYESHDLSAFCTNELHAAKAAAYILAKRYYTTHTIRFTARPEQHSKLITVGDIVDVRFNRQTPLSASVSHAAFYQVERIYLDPTGGVSYECTHFPVDDQGRSLLALAVTNAAGTGINFSSVKTGVTCDVNSSTDNTLPPDFGIGPGPEIDGGKGPDLPYNRPSSGGVGGKKPLKPSDNKDRNKPVSSKELEELGLGDGSLDPLWDPDDPNRKVRVYVIMGHLLCDGSTKVCRTTVQLAALAAGKPWIETTQAEQEQVSAKITAVPMGVNGISISGTPPIGGDCNDLCAGAERGAGCYCPGIAFDFSVFYKGATVVTNRRSWNRGPTVVYRFAP